MSKVKVSKAVFEAFKKTEGPGWFFEDKEKYLRFMLDYKLSKSFFLTIKELNDISLVTFLKALNDGYELELTPNEKVLGDYNELNRCLSFAKDRYEEEAIENSMKTIVTTLNNLEIYIEGVNK